MAHTVKIDLTYDCNLACKWCDHLCGTKFIRPDYITTEQMKHYLKALDPYLGSRCQSIAVSGGEPTLHPQFFEILEMLVEIRPRLNWPIEIFSNGVGKEVNSVLDRVREKYPTEMTEYNTSTQQITQVYICTSKDRNMEQVVKAHRPIFRASIDIYTHTNPDYYTMCPVRRKCGELVCTPYGIYICPMAAPLISSIFKLGQGFDHVPTSEEEKKQASEVCKYCPYKFLDAPTPIITSSYEKALTQWEESPCFLELLEVPDV